MGLTFSRGLGSTVGLFTFSFSAALALARSLSHCFTVLRADMWFLQMPESRSKGVWEQTGQALSAFWRPENCQTCEYHVGNSTYMYHILHSRSRDLCMLQGGKVCRPRNEVFREPCQGQACCDNQSNHHLRDSGGRTRPILAANCLDWSMP